MQAPALYNAILVMYIVQIHKCPLESRTGTTCSFFLCGTYIMTGSLYSRGHFKKLNV